MIEDVIERALSRAKYYVAEGFDEETSVSKAVDETVQECHRRGLGADILQEAEAASKNINVVISPWLWIFSVLGFMMGLVSKYEISKMYGSYKRMKQKLYR